MGESRKNEDDEAARFDRFLVEWSRREFLRRVGGAAAFVAFMTGVLAPTACTPTGLPPTAPTKTDEPTIEPRRGGIVTEGNIVPVNDFNPIGRSGTAVHINLNMLLECLYGPTVADQLEPKLAAALPTISPDGLAYTIPLRANTVWSDGRPLIADDVVFTFDLIIDPKYTDVPSGVRSTFRALVASIQATDPRTVVFHLKTRDAAFTTRLLDVNITPKHVLGPLSPAAIADSFTKPPYVVNGVWTVADWRSGDFIKYRRNESYYAGPALLDGYVYKAIPQIANLVNQFRTGEIDVSRVPTPGVYDELKAMPHLGVVLVPGIGHGYTYNLDPAKPASRLFSSKAVRQALLFAVDREAIARSVFFGFATVDRALERPTSWAYSEPKEKYLYDPEKAAALLDTDGWKVGSSGIREKNGVPLKFEFIATTGVPDSPSMGAVMQESWKRIGVELSVRPVTQPSWVQSTRVDRDFDIIYGGFSRTLDPDQTARFHSRSTEPGGQNSGHFINAKVDRLLDGAAVATDQAVRKRLYGEIQDIILDELPVGPLVDQQYAWAYNKRVQGMGPNEIGVYNIGGPRMNMHKVFVTR